MTTTVTGMTTGITGRGRTLALTAAAAGALTLGLGGAAHAQERTFEWSDAMAEGRTLEIRNISGDVRATLASGGTAEVRATKHGRRSNFDEVDVLVFDEGDRVVVCAVWGSWRAKDSCDHDDRDDRGRNRNRNIDVSVDFEVRVPAGVDFDGRTVSGDVEALGLRSDVQARTVSGDVDVSTTGAAWGTTVSGSLDLEMGRIDPARTDFQTVSGDITLRLPAGLDADIFFESLSGDFSSDVGGRFEEEKGRWVGTEVRGTLGRGGMRLTLETVSGDARLVRPRS